MNGTHLLPGREAGRACRDPRVGIARRWVGALFAGLSLSMAPPLLSAAGETPAPECLISLPSDPRPISPEIYGMAAAPLNLLTNACVPLNRWGGNTACRYNWRLGNAWNTGSDWYFGNVGVEPNAWQGFLQRAERSGCRVFMNLPLLGFVAKDDHSYAFSVKKYGPQQRTEPNRPDVGNGVRTDGRPVTGNDRYDTSIVADPAFVAEWVTEMRRASPRLFEERRVVLALGNEPMLWNATHRDVHPDPVSYDEYLRRFVAMARAVRQAAPQARIAGPELWGWPAYFQSALDRESRTTRDRDQHGGEAFLPWFLRQMQAHEKRTGERLLDVATIHYYPQADRVHSREVDLKTTALRIETVRSLYDPAYRDPSWINERVELIPRLKRWVAECYPGLQVGITEYNWGGEEDISGALALADILGIFGREGLDLACYWTHPPPGSLAAQAYALYRNADGAGAAFGDSALDAVWQGPAGPGAAVSVYASRDAARRVVTAVLVNHSALARTVRLSFKGIAVSSGKGYCVSQRADGIRPMDPPPAVQSAAAQVILAPRSACQLRFPEKP